MVEITKKSDWPLRLARHEDVAELEVLIALSVEILQAPYYSVAQRAAALGTVFGVDRQLIRDQTYFVIEREGRIVGCGGWSRRKTLCGSDRCRTGDDALLDPKSEGARIRAFFVHPDWSRRGIAAAILAACETAIIEYGFQSVELLATLAGEPLYASYGYKAVERYELSMNQGLFLPVVRMTKRFASDPMAVAGK